MNGRLTPGPAAASCPASAPAPASVAQPPLALAPKAMEAALAAGDAVPLTRHVTSLVTYQGLWWLDDDDAWLQITDQAFAAHLNDSHERQR
jgi:hypothetical protein